MTAILMDRSLSPHWPAHPAAPAPCAEQPACAGQPVIQAFVQSWSPARQQAAVRLFETAVRPPARTPIETASQVPIDAAAESTDTLWTTLQFYGQQDADPDLWNLMLLLNRRAGRGERNESRLVDTIHDFRSTYRDVGVWVMRKQYDRPVTVGRLRSDLADVALLDGRPSSIVCNDADARYISPNYIREIARAFRDHPTKLMVTGAIEWAPVGDPGLLVNRIIRYQAYMHRVWRRQGNIVILADGNTALRLKAYAAVGGFDRHI